LKGVVDHVLVFWRFKGFDSRPTFRPEIRALDQQRKRRMDAHGLIVWLIIGALAGWLAGVLIKGGGFGLIGDIVVGIIGAVIGGWLAGLTGIHIGGGFISSLITATVGAALLIFILRMLRRA
jgi:uncharacterized membrane protein YeaQ/YmgE (transglycosylase-associated protein family)